MNLLGNIVWLVFGGLVTFVEYVIAGLGMCLTIVGIPFGLQAFKLASLALLPFGREARAVPGSTGCLSTVFNILWLLIGGIWIALSHVVFALVLAITIIGIPFAIQHFKLAGLALTPFGREIVSR